jgi:CTP-dependent riboflavin kinase
MRIRGAKTEMEEAGLETDGMVESTAKLRKEVMALSGVDIMEADGKTFKSTYAILDELSKKWKDLSDIQQATVTELIAGKRQGNIVSSLMTNFDTARDALEVSLNSSGSAMQEHEKWQQSLEAQINKLKAAWQGLSQAFLKSDFLKGALDAIIGLVDGLTKLIDTFGTLPTLVTAFAAFKSFTGKGFFKVIEDEAALTGHRLTSIFGQIAAAIKQTFSSSFSLGTGFESALAKDVAALERFIAKVRSGTSAEDAFAQEMREASAEAQHFARTMNTATMSASQFETIARQSEITEQASSFRNARALIAEYNSGLQNCKLTQTEFIDAVGKSNKGFAKYLSGLNGAKGSLGGYIVSLVGAKIATFALEAATLALNAALTMGISLIVTGLVNAITSWINKEKELAEEVEEVTSAFKEQSKELKKLKKDYNTKDENSMISRYEKLSKGVNHLGQNISLTNEEYSEYLSIVNKIANQMPSLVSGYNDQGDAILNVTGNIKGLIEAYETLAKKENNDILEKYEDIKDDFDNDVEYAQHGGNGFERVLHVDDAKILKEFLDSTSGYDDTIAKLQRTYKGKDIKGSISSALQALGYEKKELLVDNYIKRVASESKSDIIAGVESFYLDLEQDTEPIKQALQAHISNLFDFSDSKYKDMSDTMKNVARQIVGKFDFDFLSNLRNEGVDPRQYVSDFIESLSNADETVGTSIEAAFNLKTQFNNNEITYGEYIKGVKDAKNAIDDLDIDREVKQDIKLMLDNDSFVQQYEDIYRYLYNGLAPDKTEEIGERIKYFLNQFTSDEISALLKIKTDIDWENVSPDKIRQQIADQVKLDEAMAFKIDTVVETAGVEALNKALSESKSATGLTAESIAALKDRYEDLDSYDAAALFEETANGIRVNSTELAKLEEEYKDFNKQEADETLKTLKKEYDKLTDEIQDCTGDQKKLNELYTKRDAILDQINNVATLAAQYAGLTSAYNEWQKAQEAGQDRDMYETILSGREEIEDEMSRKWLDDAAVEYLELLTGKELSTAGIDAQIEAYKQLSNTIEGTSYSLWDFFTQNEDGESTADGIYNFFNAVKEATDGAAAYIDENGKYNFNFEGFEYNGKVGDAAIAEIFGTSEELVQTLLKAAEDTGFVVNIKGEYTGLADTVHDIDDLNNQLKSIGATEYTFNVEATDLNYINEQIGEARNALEYFEGRDGKINLDDSDVRAAATIFTRLMLQKSNLENPTLMKLDVEQPTTKLEEVLALAQQLKNAKANLEIQTAIGADTTEAWLEVDSLIKEITSEKYAEIATKLGIKQGSADEIVAQINAIDADLLVDLDLDTSKIDGYVAEEHEAEGVVNWTNNDNDIDSWIAQRHEAVGIVNWTNNDIDVKTTFTANGTVNWTSGNKVKVNVISEANGTANANGTASGRAFKQGNWGIKGSGTALVGELGMETLVRDGRFYTIGDSGAEFIKYRQGDIIFNHRQTEELFANGKVTSGGGRGRALAEGTAFSNGGGGLNWGSIYIPQLDFGNKDSVVIVAPESNTNKTTSNSQVSGITRNDNSGAGSGGGGGAGENGSNISNAAGELGENADKFKDTFDWIEVEIERLERTIEGLDGLVNNTYASWESRNLSLADEIAKVGDEIEYVNSAKFKYLDKADAVGLDQKYVTAIKNGDLKIEDFEGEADEATLEKIKEYQKWYDLYLGCIDKTKELRQTQSELYEQRFELVQAEYEGVLQGFEHTESMLNEYISQAEAKGHIVSKQYYQALIENEKDNISKLKEEQADLIKKRDEAVASGKIKEGSEAWYNMCAEIDSVTQEIEAGTTSLIEYNNAMRDIDWEIFELGQKRISDVAAEADFLIELMSNKKLFNDEGKLTEQGIATIGLHGQNYNTYMHQADDYAAKVKEIDDKIASGELDGNSKDVIEKRQEYVELQRESILAAEGEKNAIKDLVEEGINLELDALQELIDKKNEELEAERDLYEYQKKVKEQTKEIASLEKQMAAYSGDDSEEARAKIQELKVSLEEARTNLQETEWDRYIDQQSQLLDSLYIEYETILNSRLDNVDALLGQVVDGINAAAGTDGSLTTALGANGAIALALTSGANTIGGTLKTEVGAVGATLSTAMSNIWTSDGSGKAVIDMYGKDFQTKHTTTNDALHSIKADVSAMANKANNGAQNKVESLNTNTSAVNSSTTNSPTYKYGTVTDISYNPSPSIGGPKVGDKVKFASGKYYYDSQGKEPLGSQHIGEHVYITKINTNLWATHPYHISTGSKLGNGDLGWIKLHQISGYAIGKKNFSEDEIAWTQEGGREFIVRPSDGAVLTPIAKGDSVLTSAASNNIWNMANSPAEFIKENLNLGATNVPNNSNVNNSVVQHFENITFSMPNVHGYNDLLKEMQRDPKFEKLILSMTIDQIAGKSSLAKGKSIR